MKVAIISDSHFGARGDSQVFMEYFKKFYEEVFFPTLQERGIDTIIHMGDVVDRRKYINWKTTFQMREMFFDVCSDRGIKLHLILGNHDVFFRNTLKVNALDGLRLSDNENFTVYEEPTEIELDGNKFFLQPWICDENREQSLKAIKETTAQVLFGHLEVKGFEMYAGQYSQSGVNENIFKKFDMAMSGHFHHKSDNGTVFYLGNPYEITWSDYKDPRGFHIFDTETRTLEFIQNHYRMFRKFYYDDSKETFESITEKDYSEYSNAYVKVIIQNKTNPFWFDTVLDKLYAVDVANLVVVENYLDLEFMEEDEIIDEAQDTLTILSKYVNSLNMNNKTELNTLMRDLYNEALIVDTV